MFRFAAHHAHGGHRCAAPQTGELFQDLQRRIGQTGQFLGHQIRDIVGKAFGTDSLKTPIPSGCRWIKDEQFLFGKRFEELNHEEGITAGLLVHQLRKRLGAIGLRMKGIHDEVSHIAKRKRRQGDFAHCDPGITKLFQRSPERIRSANFVVPICSDQQKVTNLRLGEQMLKQLESSRIGPLQIIKEQSERVFRLREDAEEPPEG